MEFGVEEEEEFSGGGDEGDFGGFGCGAEVLVEELQDAALLADGGEGGEVESAADGGPAAAEMALAAARAAVVGIGSEASEGGNLLAIGGAEFREEGEEACGGDLADAVLGEEELLAGGERLMAGDELLGGGLELGDLFLEVFVEAGVDLLGEGQGEVLGGVGELGLEFDELVTQGDQGREFLLLGRAGRIRAAGDGGTVEAQQAGIEAIGLGVEAAGSGKVADPGAIEHGDGEGGGVGGGDEPTLVTAGSLDQEVGVRWQAGAELAQARRRIRDPLGQRGGVEIEVAFGDIDPDGDERGWW